MYNQKRNNASITILTILILSIFISQCAPKLSQKSQFIHEEFWNENSHFYGYIMENTKYQTPIFHFQSEQEGPTVLIIGGTHGNEPAGFETAHRLLDQFSNSKLKVGEVFIIPEANKLAVKKRKRRIPVPKGIDIEKGNLNRCYPGDSTGLPMEQAAFQITKLIKEKSVTLLMDLHESPVYHLEYRDKTKQYHGLGQTLIYTPDEEATWLGMVTVDHLNSSIPEGPQQFSMVERPIKFSTAWSAGEIFKIPAFTVETCKKLPLEQRIKYQLEIVNVILKEKGML